MCDIAAGVTDTQFSINFDMLRRARHSHVLPDTVQHNVSVMGAYELRIASPGTKNYERARNISYVYPDSIGDLLQAQKEVSKLYYFKSAM